MNAFLLISTLLVTVVVGCSGKTAKTKETVKPESATTFEKGVKLTSPARDSQWRFGDSVTLIWSSKASSPIDSAQVLFQNKVIATTKESMCTLTIPDIRCGKQTFRLITYHQNGKRGGSTLPLEILPPKAEEETYRLIRRYPHNPKSYTQGLFCDNGFLYEGTGQYGESTLTKIKWPEGLILAENALNPNYFGEGIALANGEVYQLTWTSGKVFVYDGATLALKRELPLQCKEGWGITTVEELLYVSDGSHYLYPTRPDTFETDTPIEVYTHEGPLKSLNELEYANGLIWANVWQTDYIVGIDPVSGAVKKRVNLQGLLSKAEKSDLKDPWDDVLNGIALLPNGHLLVTGKHWPALFEIAIVPLP